MSGTVQLPPDSTGKVVDTSELTVGVNTVERQRIVIADPTAAASLASVTTDGGVVVGANQVRGFAPAGESEMMVGDSGLQVDPAEQLMTRSTILTDEGSFRDDFLGAAITTALTGTITVVNASVTITGSGTAFLTEVSPFFSYVKVTAHAETAWARVQSVESDTSLTLVAGYPGASIAGQAGQWTYWPTITAGSGTGTSVGSSLLNITTGTTSGGALTYYRGVDYQPMSIIGRFSISQGIVNQQFEFGFADSVATPAHQARLIFSGTSTTVVAFRVGVATDAANYTDISVTLPAAAVWTALQTYQIDVSQDVAQLTINGVVMAQQTLHLPYPYIQLNAYLKASNTGTAAGTTTYAFDFISVLNYDQIQGAARMPLPVQGTVAKGTQALLAVPTQDMKDSGRTLISAACTATQGVASETMLSVVRWLGAASTTATNFTVTTGKTFRISSMTVAGAQTTSTGIQGVTGTLRYVTSSTTTVTSQPLIGGLAKGTVAAANAGFIPWTISIADGIELAAGYNYGVSQLATHTQTTISVVLVGFEY